MNARLLAAAGLLLAAVLTLAETPPPAKAPFVDVNRDGRFDATDLQRMRDKASAADLNKDGRLSKKDLILLKKAFFDRVPYEVADPEPGTVRVTDHGLVPNDPASASANVAALRRLISPAPHCGAAPCGQQPLAGPLVFPGKQTYYFDDVIPLRYDTLVHLDLRGSTLHFAKTAGPEDVGTGFLHSLARLRLTDGALVIDYRTRDGTPAPTHAGAALMLGSRSSLGSRKYFPDVWDADLPVRMGDIQVRDLRIVSNVTGPYSRAVVMWGGLRDVHFERVHIDGLGKVVSGIVYEFGFATRPVPKSAEHPDGLPGESSHAHDMSFKAITVRNLDPREFDPKGFSGSQAMRFGGAYNFVVDGLDVDGAWAAFTSVAGEAAFYRPWGKTPPGPQRVVTVKNSTLRNVGVGLILGGADNMTHGYLGHKGYVRNPTPQMQTDHLSYVVENVTITARQGRRNVGISCDGAGLDLKGGRVEGFVKNIVISTDCTALRMDGVKVCRADQTGIHIGWNDNKLWDPPRGARGYLRNASIGGSGQLGSGSQDAVLIDYARDFVIERNTFDDPRACQAAPTQRAAVAAGSFNETVTVRDNCVVRADGGVAYRAVGRANPDSQRVLASNRGVNATAGPWQGGKESAAPCAP